MTRLGSNCSPTLAFKDHEKLETSLHDRSISYFFFCHYKLATEPAPEFFYLQVAHNKSKKEREKHFLNSKAHITKKNCSRLCTTETKYRLLHLSLHHSQSYITHFLPQVQLNTYLITNQLPFDSDTETVFSSSSSFQEKQRELMLILSFICNSAAHIYQMSCNVTTILFERCSSLCTTGFTKLRARKKLIMSKRVICLIIFGSLTVGVLIFYVLVPYECPQHLLVYQVWHFYALLFLFEHN